MFCKSLSLSVAAVVFLPSENKQTVNFQSHHLSTSSSKLKRGNHESSIWSDMSGHVGKKGTGRWPDGPGCGFQMDRGSEGLHKHKHTITPPLFYDSCPWLLPCDVFTLLELVCFLKHSSTLGTNSRKFYISSALVRWTTKCKTSNTFDERPELDRN